MIPYEQYAIPGEDRADPTIVQFHPLLPPLFFKDPQKTKVSWNPSGA
jgi:hypothetical protein